MHNSYMPKQVHILGRIQETPSIFTLRLALSENEAQTAYHFLPGQFNMLYLYGIGEVPISIVSDPLDDEVLDHTVRALGRVTKGLSRLKVGDSIGLRGPFGRAWPLQQAEGKDVIIVTGGLGCAPVVAVINYIMRRRANYRRLIIMQGVKHSDDLIWRQRYEQWSGMPQTTVLLAADVAGANWPWHVGRVTNLFDRAQFEPDSTIVMTCGPEIMMLSAIRALLQRGVPEPAMWLSMERNMQCAIGHCGHCQLGPHFVCRDGPVFNYPDVKQLLEHKGF